MNHLSNFPFRNLDKASWLLYNTRRRLERSFLQHYLTSTDVFHRWRWKPFMKKGFGLLYMLCNFRFRRLLPNFGLHVYHAVVCLIFCSMETEWPPVFWSDEKLQCWKENSYQKKKFGVDNDIPSLRCLMSPNISAKVLTELLKLFSV